jgi:hypothetical protein
MRHAFLGFVLLGFGCGTAALQPDSGQPVVDAGPTDAGMAEDAGPLDAGLDAGTDAGMMPFDGGQGDGGTLATCPAAGMGAITAPAACFVFTPVDTGASAQGDNATENHYALEPAGTPRDVLLVFFNASLANPARQIPDPTQNFYVAAASSGFHVLALAYSSTQVLGITCNNDAPCFALARKTIIRGVAEPGVAQGLANIREDEGAVWRLDAALQRLIARRPGHGWEQFLQSGASPEARLVTTKMATAGHSQGGGHAAFFAKLYPVTRVVQLSSTCDVTSGNTPAPWTSDGQWMTPPATAFVGFATMGDTICPGHVAIWNAMGVNASRQFDDAVVCNGASAHTGSINCPTNYAKWLTLF